MFHNFWNFQGGGGVTASSLKWKIRRGGGVLYDIPSVVGVWIFSGTTHSKFTHYMTLAILRVVLVRRAKAFILRKVVPLSRVTLPAKVRQLAHPSCLDPQDEFAFLM